MTWLHPPQLLRLAWVLGRAKADASSISDEDLVAQVRATYWGTTCWSWVEMSPAIISAVCALRPHLAKELIADPIQVTIAAGLDNENDVIAQGVALARKGRAVRPADGRWPRLAEAKAIFRRKWVELTEDG